MKGDFRPLVSGRCPISPSVRVARLLPLVHSRKRQNLSHGQRILIRWLMTLLPLTPTKPRQRQNYFGVSGQLSFGFIISAFYPEKQSTL